MRELMLLIVVMMIPLLIRFSNNMTKNNSIKTSQTNTPHLLYQITPNLLLLLIILIPPTQTPNNSKHVFSNMSRKSPSSSLSYRSWSFSGGLLSRMRTLYSVIWRLLISIRSKRLKQKINNWKVIWKIVGSFFKSWLRNRLWKVKRYMRVKAKVRAKSEYCL